MFQVFLALMARLSAEIDITFKRPIRTILLWTSNAWSQGNAPQVCSAAFSFLPLPFFYGVSCKVDRPNRHLSSVVFLTVDPKKSFRKILFIKEPYQAVCMISVIADVAKQKQVFLFWKKTFFTELLFDVLFFMVFCAWVFLIQLFKDSTDFLNELLCLLA